VEKIHKRYIWVIGNDKENKEIIAQIYEIARKAIDDIYLPKMKDAAQKGDVAEVEKIHKRYIEVIGNDKENKEIIAQIYNDAAEQARINKEEALRKEQEAKEEALRKKLETRAEVGLTLIMLNLILEEDGIGMSLISVGPKFGITFYDMISLSSELLLDISFINLFSGGPGVAELALNIPLLLKIYGGDYFPFYAETGIQLGFPILTSDFHVPDVYMPNMPNGDGIISARAGTDIGYVAGIGFFKPRAGLDLGLRFIWNLTDFDEYNVITDLFRIQFVMSKWF